MSTEPTAPAKPTTEQVRAFWAGFASATGTTGEPVDVFCFGDTVELADELAALVLHGPKRATAGLLADYEAEGSAPPAPGDHAVFHRGDGEPVGIIRTASVRVGPLSSVDAQFAWDEGEGDRSLDYWVRAHDAYCRRRCESLGLEFHPDVPVVFERFELAWPEG